MVSSKVSVPCNTESSSSGLTISGALEFKFITPYLSSVLLIFEQ